MINQSKFAEIVVKYEEDIDSHDYRYFVPEVLRKCGSITLKEAEDLFGFTLKAVYADREYRDEHYEIIDDVVFSATKKGLVRYSPEKTDKAYVIPEFVETVCDEAFASSSIKEIVLPKNVTSIGSRVFMNCKELVSATFENANTVLDNECFKGCHNDLIIKASSGGTVEEYARKYNIKFEAI